MLIDTKTLWGTHIPSDGSHVADGAPDPTKYSVTQSPDFHPNATLFEIVGPDWCVLEGYKLIPLAALSIPTKGSFGLQLSFELIIADANALLYETDTIFCSADGFNFNLSIQRRMDLNGMMQVAGPGKGDWLSTGIIAPPLVIGEWMSHIYQYRINLDNHTCGTQAMVIGGKLFMVPASLQGISALKKDWQPGALLQAQIALKKGGRDSTFMLRNIDYGVW